MRFIERKTKRVLLGSALIGCGAMSASAATFTTANTADAGTWGTVYGQGFSPSINANPDPGLGSATPVYLSQFQLFRGSPTSIDSPNIELVILQGAYPNLTGLTTTSPLVVGISSNIIATTATLNSGDAITFNFDNVPLNDGDTYAAGLFTQSGTALTPVSVSALTANYVASGADYVPSTNYGGLDNYNASAYGSVGGTGYYSAYGHAGDANFVATLATTVPEPTLAAIGLLGSLMIRRRPATAR